MNQEENQEMKIIREPRVYVVGRPQVMSKDFVGFLLDHDCESWRSLADSAGEILCETAGRLCYMSFNNPRPGGSKAYLEHILQSGHGSVLEHATWNFIFTGISRSLTHELVRHRAGFGYSQLSQRYVDESVAEYVEPECIASDPESHEIWQEAIAGMHLAYIQLVERLQEKFKDEPDKTLRRKMSRQAARSVLPNATETKIFVTANARALRHFIEMRGSRHAETEIRLLAIQVLKIMQREAPNLFGDYQLVPLADGTFEATSQYRKV